MEPSIFGYIREHSWRQQLVILGLTLLSFPPLYYSLELPKTIINQALAHPEDKHYVFGYQFDSLEYLFVLCGIFLVLVLIGGVLKYVLNVYAGITAERMLRRLRYELYAHVLRFPLPHLKKVSQGELVQMINAETEALGGYVGDALAVPAFQGGTLITILVFMFQQDWVLGVAAVALYPLQMYLIPKLQSQVNRLGKLRVRQVRRNAERLSETASGVRDIRANDTSRYERARFSDQLGEVFWIRYDIYKKKFLIKFINNFISQLGPFFFFSIGGYLVLQDKITLGALVAVVGAQKDLASPWKELLTYYQTMYDVKIKYEQTVTQFAPQGLRELQRLDADPPQEAPDFAKGELKLTHVTLQEDGETVIDGMNLTIPLPTRLAIVGPAGSGKEALALLIAGLVEPDAGHVRINGVDLSTLPESVLGRQVSYVGNPGYVFGGSIVDNILYGLMYRPVRLPDRPPEEMKAFEREHQEALNSGNSPEPLEADWVDDGDLGVTEPEGRLAAIVRTLGLVLFADDVYLLGLRGRIGSVDHGDLAERLLEARAAMVARLAADERLARLVETFDPERYNSNSTLAENLLFGTPIGGTFAADELAHQPYVLKTLDEMGLTKELRLVGLRVAQTMVELFADLPPGHEYYSQFSFIEPDDLPEYRSLIGRADAGRLEDLPADDQERLLSLPFKLIVARHRLDLISPELEAKVLEARRRFRENLPAEYEGSIAFFDPAHYNEPSSIQDNIIFGRIAFGQLNAAPRVAELITEVVDELGLRTRITAVGLETDIGVGGGRLSPAQRQKIVLARAVLKRPRVLVLEDPTGPLDAVDKKQIRDNLFAVMEDRTLVWALAQNDWASEFDQLVVLDRGRLAAAGTYAQLNSEGSALQRLFATN